MKKIILFVLIFFVVILTSACSDDKNQITNESNNSSSIIESIGDEIVDNANTLIIYFSYSNTTKRVAEYLSNRLQADIVNITPKVLYTKEDVDYTNPSSRSQLERKNDARPEISEETYQAYDLENYDYIFIGHPIWNNYSPMIIKTFIEHEYNSLLNKNIYTFSTSASSSGFTAFNDLKNKYKDLNFKDNLHLTSSNLNNLKEEVDNKLLNWNIRKNKKISLSFENYKIVAEISNNTPGNDLIKRLSVKEIILSFIDFNSSEKIAYINPILEISNENGYDPEIGDIVIYKPWNNLAIFYKDSASYSADLIYVGRIENEYLNLIEKISDNTEIIINLEEN